MTLLGLVLLELVNLALDTTSMMPSLNDSRQTMEGKQLVKRKG
jgi:hypothetical protein